MNQIEKYLRKFIQPEDRVLDLGCGNKAYSHIGDTVTVDAWPDVNPDILLDLEVEQLPFSANDFDHILLIDVIEHLDKEAGKRLIEDCKYITSKSIFLFTPLFWDDNSEHTSDKTCWAYGNIYNLHKSLWEIDDFVGWETLDIIKLSKGNAWLGYWQK